MANIPVNFGGTILTAGQSATGSFAGVMSLGIGPASLITGSIVSVKYGTGFSANGLMIEATAPTSFTIPAGLMIPLFITSCSVAAGSAPVILYS